MKSFILQKGVMLQFFNYLLDIFQYTISPSMSNTLLCLTAFSYKTILLHLS